MSDLFQIVETGKRALVAYQQALNVVGHNIANVNTPGFSRQRATLESTELIGSMGTGVETTAVRRVRDEFLDSQFRAESPSFGRWEALSQALSRAEEIFLEPSEYGLGSLLDDFWNGWQDLANNPEGAASRHALRGLAESLTDGFHRLSNQLEELRLSLDPEITQGVEEVNHIAGEIAELNAIISEVEGGGESANDLRDKRDLLIDQLSEILDLRTLEKEDGSVSIVVGGRFLVERGSAEELVLSVVPEGGIPEWKGDGSRVDIADGGLKGLMEARNDIIPLYQRKLDDLAKGLVNSVNAIHRRGFGLDGSSGVDFFDPTKLSAGNIAIDSVILDDIGKIAASSDGNPGDNANALAIAGLKFSPQMDDGTVAFNDFYTSLIGDVGSESKEASEAVETHQLLVEQLENRRESVKGVSLDEEIIDLIRFQHAYQAAARMVSIVSELMDTVVNMV